MLPTLNASSSRLSHRARLGLAAMAVAALTSPLVYFARPAVVLGEDPQPSAQRGVEFLPPLSPSEEKILAVLEEPTSVDFIETPLQDVVDFLKDKHSLEIQLDDKSLEEAGVSGDVPVTRKLHGIRLRSALAMLLRPLDLTYDIRDDVLQITTRKTAATWLMTRTYPVGDLADGQDYDSLVKAITTTVDPESWEDAGNVAVVSRSKSLVISQTREVHDKVLSLLRSLRAAREAPAAK